MLRTYSIIAMPAERAARLNFASSVANGSPSRSASSTYAASYSVNSCCRATDNTCSNARVGGMGSTVTGSFDMR